MTQQSRPQADNTANGYGDAGPYSYNQWAEKLYATHTGDENTAVQRALLRGVVPTFDNMLVVTTAAGDITVGTGAGFSHGSFLFNSAAVTFSPTHGVRTDYVVIVENNTNNIYNTNLQFPTVLTDYDATPALLAYTARLAILTGPAALVQTTSYWMVPLASYDIDGAGAVTNLTDLREFIDIETVVSTVALTNDEIIDALILGVEVNDGVGANDLGVGIKFRLESAAGTTEDAGQLAIRYTDSAAADETRLELRLKAAGSDNLAAVINAPTVAVGDGNARGAGAVDLQQTRTAVTDVASGINSFIAGGDSNTASAEDSHAEGSGVISSGRYAHAEGFESLASDDAAHAEGWGTEASAIGAHAEGLGTVADNIQAHAEGYSTEAHGRYSHAEGEDSIASADSAHAEGDTTTASNLASHAEGGSTIAQNDYAHAEGFTTNVLGIYGHAEGMNTYVSGVAAHAGGEYSRATKFAQFTRASGQFAASGDSQYSDYHLFRVVTHSDAAWYELFLNGAAWRLTVAADQVMTFDALIVGTTQGCTKSFAFRIVGIIENDGGTTSLLASTVTTIYDTDDTDFNARATADDPNDALLIELTDSTSGGDVVRWSAVVRCAEVTFPA